MLAFNCEFILLQISLDVMKSALEWLRRMQSLNLGKSEQFFLGLQPYLTSSKETLRIKSLIVISSFVLEITSNLIILTVKDMEFLKSQLRDATDFSLKEILKLLLSLSHLEQNVKVMSSNNLLSSLSQVFEDDNEAETAIAAQLIQKIVDFEASIDEVCNIT